jgi:hypothetical protein
MTTNVYDRKAGIMASDSRWSVQYGNYLLYVDDIGVDKITPYQGHVAMFAGDSREILIWKNWLLTNPTDLSLMPEPNKVNICLAREKDLDVIFEYRVLTVPGVAYFGGTGGIEALKCWVNNGCAKKSVATASSIDMCTGGQVMFYDLNNRDSNLTAFLSGTAPITPEYIANQVITRGTFMTMPAGLNGISSVEQSISNNSILNEIKRKLADGSLSATAPFEGMNEPWPSAEKQKLRDAFQSIIDSKK